MSNIQFRLAARTDAAGKYNENAPLEGNEDNMFVDADLSNAQQGMFMADQVVDLSEKGCLMVVADGMGGMNAGEVASAIAIKTVMEYFAPARIAQRSFNNMQSRLDYMEEVVVAADAAIKTDSQSDPEHEGMGSTIIMAWLCDGQVGITWCGDSRAYLFRPAIGFKQVSKDHSYVQGLVDDGKITEAEAFDHPYGNIITRSLGDPDKKAEPDSISFCVYEGDIIMLCSDGLSGVLRDHKTIMNGERVDTENLEDLIRDNRATMAQCRDELFAAAERNDWYDNVTAILCEIVKGDALPISQPQPTPPQRNEDEAPSPVTYAPMPDPSFQSSNKRKKSLIPILLAILVVLGLAGFLIWKYAIPKTDADAEFFAKCQKSNKIELYRSYLELYPQGSHIEDVNAWIKHYEDSIADSNLTPDPVQVTENKPEVQAVSPTEEPKDKGKDNDKNAKEDKKTDKPEANKNEEKPFPKSKADLGELNNEHPSDKSLLTQDDGKGLTESNAGLTDDDTESEKVKAKKADKKRSEMTEEDLYRKCTSNSATVEDCLEWMDKYGDANTRDKVKWNVVSTKFLQLYNARLNSCKTVEDYDNFLNNHERIMRKARLADNTPGSVDDRMRKQAIERRKAAQDKQDQEKGLRITD